MNSLPVVARELRVASRKRTTFWVRVAGAAVALVIGSGCWTVIALQGTRASQVGMVLFYVLAWLLFAAALSSGLFFTSDCLSEEKREGTLGLLFLTELRGYDVVLGKLMATSLRAFYALVAALPILAVTVLMGGISGGQYWRSSLALVNGLLLSLCAGMLISTLSRDSQKALAATLFLLILLAVGGPLADALTAGVNKRPFKPFWSASSPAYVLVAAGSWGRTLFWRAIGVTQFLSWVMLVLACVLAPFTWQERKGRAVHAERGSVHAWKYGGNRLRRKLRLQWLECSPVLWLAARERWQVQVWWGVAILGAGGFLAVLLWKPPREAWIIWNYLGGVFTLLLYVWAASQACRFLVEARRNGMLELLLIAPLREGEIIRGQWRALLGMFALPMLVLLAVHVAGSTLSQLSFQRLATGITTATTLSRGTNTTGIVTNQTITISPGGRSSVVMVTNSTGALSGVPTASVAQQVTMAGGAALAAGVSTAANLLAICWFGLWMGMTSRTANLATLKTLVFVQVIPWFVMTFGTSMVIGLAMAGFVMRGTSFQPALWFAWMPLLSALFAAALAVAKDIGFIVWSRKKLYCSLREQAAWGFAQPQSAPATPPVPKIALPPAAPPPLPS